MKVAEKYQAQIVSGRCDNSHQKINRNVTIPFPAFERRT